MNRKNGLIDGEKGAITVFLALIFISLIFFAGAVIDIVRIAAADRKVQSVLSSSARSVLAGYDRELMGEYGIYGVNTGVDTVKDDFYRYMSVNLKERHEGMNFINIEVDREDIEIKGMHSLLDDKAFRKQIQEYMKYRGPIAAAESLIEQLQNIQLGKKVEFAKSEKATREKARELRAKANEVNAKLASIKEKMKDLSVEKLGEISRELSEALDISGLIYGKDGEGLLAEYIKSKEDTNSKAEAGGCIPNQSQEFESVGENSEKIAPELAKHLQEVNNTILKVKPLQAELEALREELGELQDYLSELRDELSDSQEDEGSSSESEDIRDEINEVKEEINKVKDKIEQLEYEIDEEIFRLSRKLGGSLPEGYALKKEAVILADKKADEAKRFINQKKDEIAGALVKRLEKDWLIRSEEFDEASLIIGEDFGTMDEAFNYSSAMEEDEAEKFNDIILQGMEKLGKAVDQVSSNAVEKAYIIEYVMDKFTFLTSKTERNHYFRKGEVEYIISGSDSDKAFSPIKNTEYYVVTNVLLQVWALRFAIDTLDEFVTSTIIFPPQRLAYAIAEGALDSCLDMFNMLNGQEIPLCPRSCTQVKLKYSDHLKILLFLKPEEEILRKARQLMQVNIKHVTDAETGVLRQDFRLGDYDTVISASVKAKVNLFFLPLLKVDRLMPGSFEDGRYIIRKQIYVGY